MAQTLPFREHRERKLHIIERREADAEMASANDVRSEVFPTIGRLATKQWAKLAHQYHQRLIARAVKELEEQRRRGIQLAS